MTGLRADAPAKLNLALAVSGRRDDGYHTLRSVFVRLALHDVVEAELDDDPGAGDSLVIEGDPGVPLDGNLVLRAAADLRAMVDQPLPGLRFALTKRIPTEAGLAGGSSDAAAALDLAARAWGLRLHPAERLQAALRLGADVPFFASGYAAALVSGIGEGLERLPAPDPPAGLLLVTPVAGLSTAAVFAELDDAPASDDGATRTVAALATSMRSGISGEALSLLAGEMRDGNDLWPAAARLAPSLQRLRQRLEESTRMPFLLTGSGATLFAILPTAGEAEAHAERLRTDGKPDLEGATVSASETAPDTHHQEDRPA